MADTLEKRVQDLEMIIAHLPEDLNARFAGVDRQLGEIRDVLAVHSVKFGVIDARLNGIDDKLETMDGKLDKLIVALGGQD